MNDPVLKRLRATVDSNSPSNIGKSVKNVGFWKSHGRKIALATIATTIAIPSIHKIYKRSSEKIDSVKQEIKYDGMSTGRDINVPIVANIRGNLETITFQKAQEDSTRTFSYNIQTLKDSSDLYKINPSLIKAAEARAKELVKDTSEVAIAETRSDAYAEILGEAKLKIEQRNTQRANANALVQGGIGETIGILKKARLDNPDWYLFDNIKDNQVEYRTSSIIYDQNGNVKRFRQEKHNVSLGSSDFAFTEKLEDLAIKNTARRDSIISTINNANDVTDWINGWNNGYQFDEGIIATGNEIKTAGYKFNKKIIGPEDLDNNTIYLFKIYNGVIEGSRALGVGENYAPEATKPIQKKKLRIKGWLEKNKDWGKN